MQLPGIPGRECRGDSLVGSCIPSSSGGGQRKPGITDRLEADRLPLFDIGGLILADLDLDLLLARVLEAACQLTDARYAAVGVLDEERTELDRFITRGLDEQAEQAIGERPPCGRGPVGRVVIGGDTRASLNRAGCAMARA